MEGSGNSLGRRTERVDANGALAKLFSAYSCITELLSMAHQSGIETTVLELPGTVALEASTERHVVLQR